jgi:hypothetical protein
MVLNLAAGAAAVSGLRSDHVVLDTASVSCVMGAVFRSGGARLFFDGSALEFYERSVALATSGQATSSLFTRPQDSVVLHHGSEEAAS